MAQQPTHEDESSRAADVDFDHTVHAHRVEGTGVWLTEHVVADPDGETAPYTVRASWRVHKVSADRWVVALETERQLFDGCANGRRELTHDAHRSKLERELKHHYLKTSNASSTDRLELDFEGGDA